MYIYIYIYVLVTQTRPPVCQRKWVLPFRVFRYSDAYVGAQNCALQPTHVINGNAAILPLYINVYMQ